MKKMIGVIEGSICHVHPISVLSPSLICRTKSGWNELPVEDAANPDGTCVSVSVGRKKRWPSFSFEK
jgi:hypothetical protein